MLSTAAVLVVGTALYLWWGGWWVNWDGGFYLYLAQSLHEGRGFVFPDGSLATFRGPGYPGLFAAGWTFLDMSATTAIWMSRSVLLATGSGIAWLVARRGSSVGAVLAGLTAIVPAVVLQSGAWYFVPDGLAAGLVLAATAVIAAGRFTPHLGRGLFVGLLLAVAVLVKESSLLYSPIVLLVLWARLRRYETNAVMAAGGYIVALSGSLLFWLLWANSLGGTNDFRFVPLPVGVAVTGLALTMSAGFILLMTSHLLAGTLIIPKSWTLALVGAPLGLLGALGTLWIVGEQTVVSVTVGFESAADRLARTFGWSWVPALVLVLLALSLGRSLERSLAPLWLGGLLLVSVGLGQVWYSEAAALSLRNGVGGVFGLAVLIGVTLAALRPLHKRRIGAWLERIIIGVTVVFLVIAGLSTAGLNSRLRFAEASWENPAVHEVNAWLSASALTSVVITPVYANYIYFLGGALPDPELIRYHFAPGGQAAYQPEDFCTRIWWGGNLPACPSDTTLRVAQSNRRVVSALFVDGLSEEKHVIVVTGNANSGAAFNGSGLLYLIEKNGMGEPIFATSKSHLPHWAVVYDVDIARWSAEDVQAVIESDVDGMDSFNETIPFDSEEYLALLSDVLRP